MTAAVKYQNAIDITLVINRIEMRKQHFQGVICVLKTKKG